MICEVDKSLIFQSEKSMFFAPAYWKPRAKLIAPSPYFNCPIPVSQALNTTKSGFKSKAYNSFRDKELSANSILAGSIKLPLLACVDKCRIV